MTDNAPAGRPGFQPSHPGRILRTAIEGLGVTIDDFAARIGVSRQTVHSILSGKSAVTADVAARLGRAIGNSPLFWTNLQARHDVWAAEETVEVRQVRKFETPAVVKRAPRTPVRRSRRVAG
jgi:antitoxin HigA-1